MSRTQGKGTKEMFQAFFAAVTASLMLGKRSTRDDANATPDDTTSLAPGKRIKNDTTVSEEREIEFRVLTCLRDPYDGRMVNVYKFSNRAFLENYQQMKDQYQAEIANDANPDRKKQALTDKVNILDVLHKNALAFEELPQEEVACLLPNTIYNSTVEKTMNDPMGWQHQTAVIESNHHEGMYLRARPINITSLPVKPSEPIMAIELVIEGKEDILYNNSVYDVFEPFRPMLFLTYKPFLQHEYSC